MPGLTPGRRRSLRHGTIGRDAATIRARAAPGHPVRGPLDYGLRRSPRSRGLRITIDPRHGVVVSVPLASRRGWAHPERDVERFLAEREAWVRGHLDRMARHWPGDRPRRDRDGAEIRFLGEPHRLRSWPAPRGRPVRRHASGRPTVTSRWRRTLRPEGPGGASSGRWLRERAAATVDRSIALHAPALGVDPAGSRSVTPGAAGAALRARAAVFSWRLILAPPAASKRSSCTSSRTCGSSATAPGSGPSSRPSPDHVACRRWLRRHSHELHAALDEPGPGDGEARADEQKLGG